ncbi:Importin-11 [Vanrija pseudolonga]|uniref:Importin-11 n=1 Tax=Vanrija pseudolonga TaxID=143232 RepID=A0AAF1BIK6_9TREE|nr:Importin-11 [Vanrija pseudolonga]
MAAAQHPDLRVLLHSLVNPTSNEAYVRDQAALTELFKQPEFFIALQAYAADKSLSQGERLLASVITGRELKTKWRSKALVPEARKPELRERLFTFLEEPDFGIARPQLSLLVAVARIEYPRQFPTLPTLLLNPLLTCLAHLDSHPHSTAPGSSTVTVLLNTLWTINALVKEWRTVKIASSVQVLQTLEEVFAAPVGKVLEIWANRERNGDDDWVIGEAGRYAFKILARFGQWHWTKAKGLQSAKGLEHIKVLLHHSVHYAPLIQEHRLRLLRSPPSPTPPEYTKLIHSLIKHLRAIGKWWRVMIAADPKGWCQLEGATNGVGWWWGAVGGVVAGSDGAVSNDDSDENPYPKRFLLLGMLLFKDILPILAHDHPDIFTPDFILAALHLLIDKLLPLTSTDLEGLEDEAEEWLIAESHDEEAWAFEFRPCAERVLIALNNACRHLPADRKPIEPEMLRILAETEAIPPTDLASILRKEAVYCAVGRLSRALATHGGVDFNRFLQGVSSWLGQPQPLLRILKRRVAWLIGQWVGSDEECAKIGLVWQILIHLLAERGEASDAAVNLTAAIAVKECVDLWELEVSYFVPYIQQTVDELIKLLGEATTLDGKRYVNDTIGVIIERVEDKMMPYLPTLAQAIPGLWHGASGLEGEWLFKASLVVLTTKIVAAAKESSGNLMELVIPLIEESLQEPAKAFFEEDGIILWQTALWNAASPYQPTPETGLIRLLPGLLGAIGENMDLIKQLLPLLDSYLLLDAAGITQNFGGAICNSLMQAITTAGKNAEAVVRILTTVHLLVQTAPLESLAHSLLESGLYNHILQALEDDKASGTILAAYLFILARIALRDPTIFLQLASEQARISHRDGHKLLEEVFDAMWRNFDYVAESRNKKTIAMGAGALLTTGHTQALERLDGEFMNIFLDVLGDLSPVQDDGSLGQGEASINHWKNDNPTQWGEIEHTPEGSRRSTLEDADPAFHIPLRSYVVDVLTRAQAVGLGPYWDRADAGAKNSLQKFLA